MSVFEDPGNDLQWLEDELLDEELAELLAEKEEEKPARMFQKKKEKPTMADRQAVYIEKKRNGKGLGKYKFLAFVEILGILALIWWWIKWLY